MKPQEVFGALCAVAGFITASHAGTSGPGDRDFGSYNVHVKTTKGFYNTGLRIVDFSNTCTDGSLGAMSWSSDKNTAELNCTAASSSNNWEYFNRFTFEPSGKLVFDLVGASDTGFQRPADFIDKVYRSRVDRYTRTSFNIRDELGRLVDTGKNVRDFHTDCAQLKGKTFTQTIDAEHIQFSCKRTLDFIEHPAIKPATVTFNFLFKDDGNLILLERVNVNDRPQLRTADVESLIANLNTKR
jgi:hypothetical protein